MSPLSAFTYVYSLFFKIIRKNVDLASFLNVAQNDGLDEDALEEIIAREVDE